MKNKYILLPFSILLITGCVSRKDKKEPNNPQECASSLCVGDIEERTSIFDEHEEGFILEESTNPFIPHDGDIELVDAPLWEEQDNEFEPVYFEFDQYHILPEQRPALERNLAKMKPKLHQENAFLVIEGHACKSAGTPRYNTMLSERRAQTVKKVLVEKGIDAHKIKTVGRGSEMSKVPGGNREQQAPNRRVEFYLVYEKQ